MDYINKVKIDGTDYILSNLTDGTHTVSLPELSADDEFALQSNVDAALDSKANKNHTHTISNVDGLQDALDEKANSSHGTHVTYSTTAPVMDGTASVGTASTVARSDHRHPVDTSRASQTEFDTHVNDNTKHITSTERTNWNAAKTHADSAHAPSNAEKNQNAFSNVKIGDGTGAATISAGTATDTLTLVAGNNVTIDSSGKTVTITSTDTNTKYSAGAGISLNGTTFSNSGVRSVATGTTNGTISVNTNGSSTNVAVKGLGTAAYTDVGSYDASGAADTALANAKTYADSAATKVKNDLLNGAGEAYDTLKELGDLIDENSDAIDALKTVASGKADKVHTHEIADVTNLQTALDGKSGTGHNHDSRYYTESEIDTKVETLNAAIAGKLSTTGGTLTGNLTGKYLIGTWLQTTDVTEANSTSKVAVIDNSGWIYYRTLANLKTDLSIPTKTSQLINDSNYAKETWVTQQIQAAIDATWEASY